MKLWPTLGVAFLLIAAWGTSMRLSWSLGRENARNEAQTSTLKSTVDTLNIISAGVPDVVAMTGTGNPFLMSFFTQTTDGKLNLMHHKKAGNTKLGEFGNYSNDWQTLELVFTAGSATVTPKLNGVAGPAFQVIKDSLTLGLNALTLTDITKNATYGVDIGSLVLEINNPAA
ncbi:phage protein [Escherichia coli]|nr:phage protein [Escherichia coli]